MTRPIALCLRFAVVMASIPMVACQLAFPTKVGPWCKSQGAHLFCSDFDGLRVDQDWDVASEVPVDAHVAQDGDEFQSPPYSMVSSTPETFTSDTYPLATVEKRLQLDRGGVRVAFDLLLDTIVTYPSGAWSQNFETVRSETVVINLTISHNPDGTYLMENRYYSNQTDEHIAYLLSASPNLNKQWTRVAIALGPVDGGTSTTADVSLDGMRVLAGASVTAYDTSTPCRFSLGLAVRGGPSPPWRAQYDNYVIDSP